MTPSQKRGLTVAARNGKNTILTGNPATLIEDVFMSSAQDVFDSWQFT